MDIKNTNSLTPALKAFGRFHLTIFIVMLTAGLAVAVLTLNGILIRSGEAAGYTSTLDNTSFDQTTIDRLNKLRTSSDPAIEYSLPAGRTSPFSE